MTREGASAPNGPVNLLGSSDAIRARSAKQTLGVHPSYVSINVNNTINDIRQRQHHPSYVVVWTYR